MRRLLLIFVGLLATAECLPQNTDNVSKNEACSTDTITNGECVPYYLCTENNTINTDGTGLINNRVKICSGEWDMCCGISNIIENPFSTSTNPTNDNINQSDDSQDSGYKSCSSDNVPNGECVPYYLCNDNNTINTNGEKIIDIRAYGPCSDYTDLCCKPSDVTDKPILPPRSDISKEGKKCGFRNVDGVGFKITGDMNNEAKFGEFPWTTAILREELVGGSSKKLNVFVCGGSLIHQKVVLTAAHCVKSKDDGVKYKVRAGEWDTQTTNEIYTHQDRYIEKIIVHPQYFEGPLYNDIAILILTTPVDDAEHIGYACLPPATEEPPDSRCLSTGWGKDVFGKEGKYQVILKSVDLPIVQRKKCQDDLRKTRLGKRFELHRTFICAGGEKGKDTCKGDGGSPLVCPIPNKPGYYMQSGIVAWGIGCGDSEIPGVYVHVGALREWIDEQLIYNNIDMTPYKLN